MNFILSNIALGCEYRDSRHEILIKVHDPIFFLSYNPQFVFYKKGMIINHYMGEDIGYNLPGDQNKRWKFYDDLGVAVLTADKDLEEAIRRCQYELDKIKYKLVKSTIYLSL